MDTERCREFAVLAQTRNFLEASNQLFIAQSSLSKHIKALEKDLGVTLLDRSTRHVDLTPEGRVFLPFARKMESLDHEARTALFNTGENARETLSVGSIPMMVPYGITKVLARFERDNVDKHLQIVEGETDDLKDMLRKRQLDLAFIREWDGEVAKESDDAEFSTVPFAEDRLVAILPDSHPLADAGRIRLGELANEEFLLLPQNTLMYALILDACALEGFAPQVRYQGKRASNIIDLVSQGMGVSLLMRKPALSIAKVGVAVVEVEPTVTTQIKVYYRRNDELSTAAWKFLAYLPPFVEDGLA